MGKKTAPNASLAEIKQFQLTLERMDFVLPQMIDFVRSRKWINIRPEYQRRLVWDVRKRSLLIESLLLNIPVPPVFLFEHEWGRYEVMDGQQRINAVLEFMEEGFALKKLERLPELNDLKFSELPSAVQRVFDRRRLSATVLLAESATTPEEMDDLRRLVFERLNTGGQSLNKQELRNCLYSGTLNDLIVELAAMPLFCDVWGIPHHPPTDKISEKLLQQLAAHSRFKSMDDCEIVLRFFAFSLPASQLRGSVSRMLDNYMRDNRNPAKPEIEILRNEFSQALETSVAIFGTDGFRIPTETGELRQSEVFFDAVMVSVSRLLQRFTARQIIAAKTRIRQSMERAIAKKPFYELMVGRGNTAKTLKDRFVKTEQVIAASI